jgi:hypothetical protein
MRRRRAGGLPFSGEEPWARQRSGAAARVVAGTEASAGCRFSFLLSRWTTPVCGWAVLSPLCPAVLLSDLSTPSAVRDRYSMSQGWRDSVDGGATSRRGGRYGLVGRIVAMPRGDVWRRGLARGGLATPLRAPYRRRGAHSRLPGTARTSTSSAPSRSTSKPNSPRSASPATGRYELPTPVLMDFPLRPGSGSLPASDLHIPLEAVPGGDLRVAAGGELFN